MLGLEGRVAIVTGGAQGIGRATVMALANAGAKIGLTNIRCAKLDETIQELKDMGREVLKFCVDVTDVAAVQEMVDQTIATWGKIDILVNNAGITKDNLGKRRFHSLEHPVPRAGDGARHRRADREGM